MKNFDNASTTQISKESLAAYNYASEFFHNPSALYEPSLKSMKMIDEARTDFLTKLKAKNGSTIIFTGSASESNNSVLFSCINRKDKKYLIGGGEHSSIYTCAKRLIEMGYNIEFIPLLKNGGVDVEALKNMLDDKVAFVSIIHVSNETGVINDIKAINRMLKSYNNKILFHVDGVQALGKVNINLTDMGVDYYTLSAHKINGPKGVGVLYIASPNRYRPYIYGGEQEGGLRAGTENLPGIWAFKTAFDNLVLHDYSAHKEALLNNIDADYTLVSSFDCIDNIISLCFANVRGETILHMLEANGYLVGTGSACNSKAGHNRVLEQIVAPKYLPGAIRISFDSSVTVEDCKNLGILITKSVKDYIVKTK